MADNPISGNKDLRLMVIGRVISILGSVLPRSALSLYVLDITGRTDIYAALYAFSGIPPLISPVDGAVTGRFDRRNLMVLFDFTSGMVISLYYVGPRLEGTPIFLTGAALIPLSVISSMYGPMVTTSIPLLVEEEHLEEASGLINGVQAPSDVTAPLIDGMFYGIFGVRVLMCVSGTAFICPAVLELFIHIPFRKHEFTTSVIPTIAADLKESSSYVSRDPLTLHSTTLASLLNLVLTPSFMVGGPIILRTVMKSTDAMCGTGMGTINLVTILGTLSMGAVARKVRMEDLHRLLAAITLLLSPVAPSVAPVWISRGFYSPYLMFLARAAPIVMIMTIISIFVVIKVQRETPNENLGRVMAIIMAVLQCAVPLGQLVHGFIFQTSLVRIHLPVLFTCIAMAVISLTARKLWSEITIS